MVATVKQAMLAGGAQLSMSSWSLQRGKIEELTGPFMSELALFKQISHKSHIVILLSSHWNGRMDFEVGS